MIKKSGMKKSGRLREIARRDEGEGFIDVLVKMLIAVVVGALLLTAMKAAVPQMFTDMIAKVRTVFEL